MKIETYYNIKISVFEGFQNKCLIKQKYAILRGVKTS